MLLPRLNLVWLKPSLTSASPFVPTGCELGGYLKLGLTHVNLSPWSIRGEDAPRVLRDLLGTWRMFHKPCFFYFELLHGDCPPHFLLDLYASGPLAIWHIIIYKYFWRGGGTAEEASEQHDFLPLEVQAHPAPQKRIIEILWKYIYRMQKNIWKCKYPLRGHRLTTSRYPFLQICFFWLKELWVGQIWVVLEAHFLSRQLPQQVSISSKKGKGLSRGWALVFCVFLHQEALGHKPYSHQEVPCAPCL